MSQMGEGIKKVDDSDLKKPKPPEGHESAESEESSDKTPEVKTPKWMEKYEDEPFTLDQMVRHPTSYRQGPPQITRYCMTNESDRTALNQILAKTEPTEAPTVIIEHFDKNFSEKEGDYVILVVSRKVMYKHPQQ